MDEDTRTPVILLSYPHSGATLVQEALTAGADLACTSGTGILPMCELIAAVWAGIEGDSGPPMSQLARSAARSLVSAQLSCLLAQTGRRRWCELATAPPDAARAFLQLFPAADVVCVHRTCTGLITQAVRDRPWGLGPDLTPFTLHHPGNTVAALASFWLAATEGLLDLEAAEPGHVQRIRYEDLAGNQHTLADMRARLRLPPYQETTDITAPAATPAPATGGRHPPIPLDMIPDGLRERIEHAHDRLGYAALQNDTPTA